jgi:DNA-directed RNA polymerase specialized sigma24 family protein
MQMAVSLLEYPHVVDRPANYDDYRQLAADLLLTGNLKVFRERLSKTFGPGHARTVHPYIDSLLGSREAKYAWRTVAYALRHGCSIPIACLFFNIKPAIVDEILLACSDHALQHVGQMAHSAVTLDPLTAQEEAHFTKQLRAYARRLAHQKLKFLVCYDTSTDIDDYVQSLMMKGMTTIWRYAHFTKEDGTRDTLKVLNYAKAGLHNSAMSIIRSNTLESRARIRNNMETCGECPACKRDDPMQCYYAAPQYEATTVSVDLVSQRGHKDLATCTVDATEARMVLNRLAQDPQIAQALLKTFGTTDVATIVETQDNDSSYRKLSSALRGIDLEALT